MGFLQTYFTFLRCLKAVTCHDAIPFILCQLYDTYVSIIIYVCIYRYICIYRTLYMYLSYILSTGCTYIFALTYFLAGAGIRSSKPFIKILFKYFAIVLCDRLEGRISIFIWLIYACSFGKCN